jgi:hypothetical protein
VEKANEIKGHIIVSPAGSSMTARSKLQFKGDGVTVTDKAGTDTTEIAIDGGIPTVEVSDGSPAGDFGIYRIEINEFLNSGIDKPTLRIIAYGDNNAVRSGYLFQIRSTATFNNASVKEQWLLFPAAIDEGNAEMSIIMSSSAVWMQRRYVWLALKFTEHRAVKRLSANFATNLRVNTLNGLFSKAGIRNVCAMQPLS